MPQVAKRECMVGHFSLSITCEFGSVLHWLHFCRVGASWGSHINPGIFQSHEGNGTCEGQPENDCSSDKILLMVKDGISGTLTGAGLKQCAGGATNKDAQAAQHWYEAGRIYNSGSLDSSGSLSKNAATACYCSNVANRLIGKFFST